MTRPDAFFIRIDRKYIQIQFSEILYMESVHNYIKIHIDSGSHLTWLTMKQLVSELPEEEFAAVSRGVLVPVARIACFDRDGVMLKGEGNIHLSFGYGYKKKLEEKIRIIEREPRATVAALRVGPDGLGEKTTN